MKANSLELDLRSRRNPCSEIRKSLRRNLGGTKKFRFLKLFILTKLNLNYLESEDYEDFTLLT